MEIPSVIYVAITIMRDDRVDTSFLMILVCVVFKTHKKWARSCSKYRCMFVCALEFIRAHSSLVVTVKSSSTVRRSAVCAIGLIRLD